MPLPDEQISEIVKAVRSREFDRLRKLAEALPPNVLATLVGKLDEPEEAALLFRSLPRGLATEVFEYLPHKGQWELTRSLANDEVASVLETMADDDRTRFFEELPSGVTQQLLELLSEEERAKALNLLGYPKHSVGRLMTPHYIRVKPSWTVGQTLEHVRKFGKDSETLTMVYVVNDRGILIDDIRMRAILLADLDTNISELMNDRLVFLRANDSQEDAVSTFREADLPALPVTDADGVLIGVVTADDILDIAEEEATEDIQRFGGLEALELPYSETSITTMLRKRSGWLIVLLLGQTLTASAMGYFENEIEQAVVLALFVPLIISSGGNSGSQAATLVIRAMALKELSLGDWWLVMRRELLTGLALGLVLGSLGFLRVALWHTQGFADYTEHWFLVAFTIGLSLVGIVLWGSLSGSMIPFVMRRFGLDPATSSAPLVATLVDVTGIVIYFSIAAAILAGTIL